MNTGIHVGTSVETIEAARAAILAIVQAPAGDKVKCAALQAFGKICTPTGTVISHCHMRLGEGDTAIEIDGADNTMIDSVSVSAAP